MPRVAVLGGLRDPLLLRFALESPCEDSQKKDTLTGVVSVHVEVAAPPNQSQCRLNPAACARFRKYTELRANTFEVSKELFCCGA